ncbi:MAG: hypothetical protein NZM00_02775, partial [Anaerolinea sp.]|nr:hypothetical protein [Anaerolinea sp.]
SGGGAGSAGRSARADRRPAAAVRPALKGHAGRRAGRPLHAVTLRVTLPGIRMRECAPARLSLEICALAPV